MSRPAPFVALVAVTLMVRTASAQQTDATAPAPAGTIPPAAVSPPAGVPPYPPPGAYPYPGYPYPAYPYPPYPAYAPPARPPYVPPEDGPRTAFNAVYLEILGAGGAYSLNYDRMLHEHFSVRVGFTYYAQRSGDVSSTVTVVPLLAHVLIGGASHKLELGAGIDVAHGSGSSTGFLGEGSNGDRTIVFPIGSVAYRYAPVEGGAFFRVGAMPVVIDHDLVPWWPAVGIGGIF